MSSHGHEPQQRPPLLRAAAVRLDRETIDQLAQCLAEHLCTRLTRELVNELADLTASSPASDEARSGSRLLTASQVSEWWGVQRSWVYRHSGQLGALHLGTGRKPRLRFDPVTVTECLGERPAAGPPRPVTGPASGPHRRPRAGIARDCRERLPLRGGPELSSPHENARGPGGARTPPATAPKLRPSAHRPRYSQNARGTGDRRSLPSHQQGGRV